LKGAFEDSDRQYRLEKKVVASHQSITMCGAQVLVTFAHGGIGQIAYKGCGRVPLVLRGPFIHEMPGMSEYSCQNAGTGEASTWLARRAQKTRQQLEMKGRAGCTALSPTEGWQRREAFD
jgi:hypothetical protein